MSIYKYFYPDYSFHSIEDIDVSKLKEMGYKLAILDIDNTLVPYTSPKATPNAIKFLNSLKNNGIYFSFVSNNDKERIEKFNEEIGAKFQAKAKKPFTTAIFKMIDSFGVGINETVLIGDQIFTDIWGGKRAKITTFLVEPIQEVDTLFFRFKRYFEKKVIKSYNKYLEEKSE